jgi:hypothetical protein
LGQSPISPSSQIFIDTAGVYLTATSHYQQMLGRKETFQVRTGKKGIIAGQGSHNFWHSLRGNPTIVSNCPGRPGYDDLGSGEAGAVAARGDQVSIGTVSQSVLQSLS